MRLQVYHCFDFGEKRSIRKYGIKIKKVRGQELTYLLIVPDEMIYSKRGCLGGIEYQIRATNGYYLGKVYVNSLIWTPGYDLDPYF